MNKRGLTKIPVLAKGLERDEERFDCLSSKITSISSMQEQEKVQASPKNTLELMMAVAADLEHRIARKKKRLDRLHKVAKQMIASSGLKHDEKEILLLRYATEPKDTGREYFRWDEIAEIMHYNSRYIYKLHAIIINK